MVQSTVHTDLLQTPSTVCRRQTLFPPRIGSGHDDDDDDDDDVRSSSSSSVATTSITNTSSSGTTRNSSSTVATTSSTNTTTSSSSSSSSIVPSGSPAHDVRCTQNTTVDMSAANSNTPVTLQLPSVSCPPYLTL